MQTKLLEEEGRMRSLTSSASRPSSSSFGSNQRLGQCSGFQLFLESLSILLTSPSLHFSLLLRWPWYECLWLLVAGPTRTAGSGKPLVKQAHFSCTLVYKLVKQAH